VTLLKSNSVWKKLVLDAKERGCFYEANEDKSLSQAITAALVELEQLDILLNNDSLLFKEARWKVGACNVLVVLCLPNIIKAYLSLIFFHRWMKFSYRF
jgi:hypothetical protein